MLKMSILHISACIKISIKDPYWEVHEVDLWKRTRVYSSMGAGRKEYSVSSPRREITHLGGWVEQETQKYTGS